MNCILLMLKQMKSIFPSLRPKMSPGLAFKFRFFLLLRKKEQVEPLKRQQSRSCKRGRDAGCVLRAYRDIAGCSSTGKRGRCVTWWMWWSFPECVSSELSGALMVAGERQRRTCCYVSGFQGESAWPVGLPPPWILGLDPLTEPSHWAGGGEGWG